MSGECSKCGEHALECMCNEDPAIRLAASILAQNIHETEIKIALESMEKLGLMEEFKDFYSKAKIPNVIEAMQEFSKLHPDKFYLPKDNVKYATMVVIG